MLGPWGPTKPNSKLGSTAARSGSGNTSAGTTSAHHHHHAVEHHCALPALRGEKKDNSGIVALPQARLCGLISINWPVQRQVIFYFGAIEAPGCPGWFFFFCATVIVVNPKGESFKGGCLLRYQ